MATGLIGKMIRQTYRNQLIILGGLLALLIAAIIPALNYYANVLSGPTEITAEELVNIRDVNQLDHFFVTLKGDVAYPIGKDILVWSDGTRDETNVRYATMPIGERNLLIKTPGSTDASEFTGTLSEMPPDVCRILIKNCVFNSFLPLMLNTGDFRVTGLVSLGAVILLVLIFVWGILYTRRQMRNPSEHPIMRTLARFGDAQKIANQLDTELDDHFDAVGKIRLTKHWLVYGSLGALSVTRFQDIIWIYKAVVHHSTNGAATGDNVSMKVWDRHGTCITITDNDNQINDILKAVGGRAPWAFSGYSPDLEHRFKTNPTELLHEVDRRKWGVRTF
ncbi:MAG: DUF6709 family protein [Chloroflexota bacterium]